MKIVGLIASLLVGFISSGQNSYYFSDPLMVTESNNVQVDSKYFGTYSSLDQPNHYEISADGIFLISTNISSISRETIRESSKYIVRNGFILGVLKNDSVPCVLEGDSYFFGIQNKEIIVGLGSENILTKIDELGNYIINTYDNEAYIPMKITFKNHQFHIAYFDYETDTKLFNFIKKQTSALSENLNIVILSPSEKETKRLFKNNLFGDTKIFNKI